MDIGTPRVTTYADRPYIALRRRVVMPIGRDASDTMDQPCRKIDAQGVR